MAPSHGVGRTTLAASFSVDVFRGMAPRHGVLADSGCSVDVFRKAARSTLVGTAAGGKRRYRRGLDAAVSFLETASGSDGPQARYGNPRVAPPARRATATRRFPAAMDE